MKVSGLLRLLTSRMFLTFLLIGVQIAWFYLMLEHFLTYSDWISAAFQVLSLIIALYIINKDDIPAYKMGWILVIMTLPLFGGLLYILLGEKRPAYKMRRQIKWGERNHRRLLEGKKETKEALGQQNLRALGTFEYVYNSVGFPYSEKTQVKYHSLGEEHYADILEELKKAQRFIFLEYFIIQEGKMWDSILEILVQKVKEGLDVRLIYDDMGCLRKIPSKYYAKIEKLGIKCLVFNRVVPLVSVVMNNRDHRKILIIDGHTAFTGGVNLADEYINHVEKFGHWKDSGVMIKGQAVWNFTVMFLEMWNSFRPTEKTFEAFKTFKTMKKDIAPIQTDGFVLPFSDSPLDGETVSVNVYLDILSQAKRYVYIFTPYLAISDELQLALCSAAKRGVDVRMVLPGIPDKKIAYRLTRSYYRPPMKAGVKLYEYVPGFIHAKSYVCDDEIAVVGTINMDFRSLYLHFECGVIMYGCSAIGDIKRDALETFKLSHRVLPNDRNEGPIRKFLGGLFDSILRVFAPMF